MESADHFSSMTRPFLSLPYLFVLAWMVTTVKASIPPRDIHFYQHHQEGHWATPSECINRIPLHLSHDERDQPYDVKATSDDCSQFNGSSTETTLQHETFFGLLAGETMARSRDTVLGDSAASHLWYNIIWIASALAVSLWLFVCVSLLSLLDLGCTSSVKADESSCGESVSQGFYFYH